MVGSEIYQIAGVESLAGLGTITVVEREGVLQPVTLLERQHREVLQSRDVLQPRALDSREGLQPRSIDSRVLQSREILQARPLQASRQVLQPREVPRDLLQPLTLVQEHP